MNNADSGAGENIDSMIFNNQNESEEESIIKVERETITGNILMVQALLKAPEKPEDHKAEEELPF